MNPMIPAPNGKRGFIALLWIFALSFAFDFRGEEGGGSAVQYLFLLLALVSGTAIAFIGRAHLLRKPVAYLIILWWAYLAYAFGVALLNGVPLGRFVRVIVPLVLLGFGIIAAHVAGCRRLRPEQIVAPIVVAAAINILWRVFHGFAFKGVTIATVRVEILSPAINWSFAYIGVALLLAPGFKKSAIVLAAASFACMFLSVTRGLLFPILASAVMTWLCLFLAIRWRVFNLSWIPRKLVPIGAVAGVLIAGLVVASLLQPTMLERWQERLFNSSNGLSTVDPSLLTRQAEAVAMFDLLKAEPLGFVYGRGVGGAYYWDDSFYSQLWEVYPDDHDFSGEFWFAGHSVWTWSVFSGGAIGTLFYIALFVGCMVLSLLGARRNAPYPGFSVYLAFLPFVAAWCTLSESATSNPFDERLTGLIFGMMVGLPQVFFVRARDCAAYFGPPPAVPAWTATHGPAYPQALYSQ